MQTPKRKRRRAALPQGSELAEPRTQECIEGRAQSSSLISFELPQVVIN